MEPVYYLYRHVRSDTNEVFYVGIGTKNCNALLLRHIYVRAYAKIHRNSHWKNIIKLTEYKIEILLEHKDREYIKTKEIEFISLYGRYDRNRGTLCNWTNGGEGADRHSLSEDAKRRISIANTGRIKSEETLKKLSIAAKGRKRHPEELAKFIKTTSKEVLQYTSEGDFIKKWDSSKQIAEFYCASKSSVQEAILKNTRFKGFQWKYYQEMYPLKIKKWLHKFNIPVIQMDLDGNFIKEWDSATEVERNLGICLESVRAVCLGKIKSTRNFIFKNKQNEL